MSLDNTQLISTFSILFLSAISGGVIAKKLRMPLIVGYIVMGFFLGNLFSPVLNRPILTMSADIGVTLLLFTVGLEFSLKKMQHHLRDAFIPAILQIALVTGAFLPLFLVLRFPLPTSVIFALAASFSSTAIVVRLFSEKGEMETNHGRLATAWLIIQDLAIIPVLIFIPLFSPPVSASIVSIASSLLVGGVKAIFIIGVIVMFGRSVVDRLLSLVSSNAHREVFLLTVVAIVFLVTIVMQWFGVSTAIGAFVAGLLLSEATSHHAVFSEIRPLRDIFAVLFFVSLGLILPLSDILMVLPKLLLITPIAILGKVALVYTLARYFGHHKKTAFLVAVSLSQISEFSFLVAAQGKAIGILSSQDSTLLIAVTFMTILITSPFITRGHTFYLWLHKRLGSFWPGIFPSTESVSIDKDLPIAGHVVICGYGRVGKYIGRALEMAHIPFVVVDYNHTTVATLRARGFTVVYGDPADREILDFAQVDHARAVVIAIPDRQTQELIIGHTRSLSKRVRIICRTHHEEDQTYLKALGVHTIIQPEFEASLAIVSRLLADFGVSPEDIGGKISRLKIEHGLG